jgi:hypothetical protein
MICYGYYSYQLVYLILIYGFEGWSASLPCEALSEPAQLSPGKGGAAAACTCAEGGFWQQVSPGHACPGKLNIIQLNIAMKKERSSEAFFFHCYAFFSAETSFSP